MTSINYFIKPKITIKKKTKIIASLKDKINIYYYENLIEDKIALDYFSIFEKNLEYNPAEESKVKVWNKEHYIPRKQVAYGHPSTYYSFAGNTIYAKNWFNDNIVCNIIRKILIRVELFTGYKFNFVLINRYNDGTDNVGFHKDSESTIDIYKPIVGISLGATRLVKFKNIPNKVLPKETSNKQEFSLNNGSIFGMNYPTNLYWKHSIPKVSTNKCNSPRISLTFRVLNI